MYFNNQKFMATKSCERGKASASLPSGAILFAILLLFCLPLFTTGCGDRAPSGVDKTTSAATGEIGTAVGQTVPDFSVRDSDGNTRTLSTELKQLEPGNAVVLYFTMWCPVCTSDMDHMRDTIIPAFPQSRYYAVDYVSSSVEESREQKESNGYSGSPFIVLADTDRSIYDMFNATMDTTVVIDGSGVVRMNEYYKDGRRLLDALAEVRSESGPGSAPDTTPPIVLSVAPEGGSGNAAIDTLITATFSEDVDPSTIIFKLDNTAGTVSYDQTKKVATFTPSTNLAYSTKYMATIAKGAKDKAGNAMAADYAWSFKTRSAGSIGTAEGQTAPDFSVNDSDGNTKTLYTELKQLEPGNAVVLYFTMWCGTCKSHQDHTLQAIIPRFPKSRYYLVDYVSSSVEKSREQKESNGYSGSPFIVLADTDRSIYDMFNATMATTVVIDSSGVVRMSKDYQDGARLLDALARMQSESGADTTPPIVLIPTPRGGETSVATNSNIFAPFNEELDPSTINKDTFILKDSNNNPVAGEVKYYAETLIAKFDPSADLSPNAEYTATIAKGVKDKAGNATASDYTWKFETDIAPDTIPPSVVWYATPANGAAGVPVNARLTIRWRDYMDPTTINRRTFTLKDSANKQISGEVTFDSQIRGRFTPIEPLKEYATYTATISKDVKDRSGNAALSDYTWSFTTGSAPMTASFIESTSPRYGEDMVRTRLTDQVNTVSLSLRSGDTPDLATEEKITVTFFMEADPSTINSDTFKLMEGDMPVVGTAAYDAETKIATFTPIASLKDNTTYTATITKGVKDKAGNKMTSDYIWSFTTMPITEAL